MCEARLSLNDLLERPPSRSEPPVRRASLHSQAAEPPATLAVRLCQRRVWPRRVSSKKLRETSMNVGAIFPQTEIGADPAVIRDFAQAVEALGYDHLVVFDHVLGAD